MKSRKQLQNYLYLVWLQSLLLTTFLTQYYCGIMKGGLRGLWSCLEISSSYWALKKKLGHLNFLKNVTSFRSKQIPLMLVCGGEETFLNEILRHSKLVFPTPPEELRRLSINFWKAQVKARRVQKENHGTMYTPCRTK